MRVGYAALPSGTEYRVPYCGRSSALNTETPQAELSLTNTVHQLNAGNRDGGVAKLLESQHRSDALLDAAVVLFNQVIEIFRRTQLGLRWNGTFGFQLAHRTVRRSVAVQRESLRRVLLALNRLAEEGLGNGYVASGTQPEVDCPIWAR